MEVQRLETGTETTLAFRGSLRIAEADSVKAAFLEALATPHPLVTLDLDGVEALDLTFLQLALALQKSLTDQGRHLILRTLPSQHLVPETARLLGLPLPHHFTQVEAAR